MITTDRRTILLGVLAASVLSVPITARTSLIEPFEPLKQRWPRIASLNLAAPPIHGGPATPPPVHSLIGTTYYTDSKNSVIDRDRLADWREQRRPLMAFLDAVESRISAWHASLGRDTESAKSAVRMLDGWARAGALTGEVNFQGMSAVRWSTAGIAVAYLSMWRSSEVAVGAARRIQDWLGLLARRSRASASTLRNNHLYWAGAAAAAGAIAANDQETFAWAIRVGQEGAAEITSEGALPRELARGPRALDYHCFALSALLLIAELAAVNGYDLYNENEQALARLAKLVIRSIDDPSIMEQLAGSVQIWAGLTDHSLAWAEIWHSRFPHPRLQHLLSEHRPLSMPYMGGNQTLLFGKVL